MKISKRVIGEIGISLGVILIIAGIASTQDPIVTKYTAYVTNSNPNKYIDVYSTYPTGGIYNFIYAVIAGLSILGLLIVIAAYHNKPFLRFIGVVACLTAIVATFIGVFNAYNYGFNTTSYDNTIRKDLQYNYDDLMKVLLIGWGGCGILLLFYWSAKLLKSDSENENI